MGAGAGALIGADTQNRTDSKDGADVGAGVGHDLDRPQFGLLFQQDGHQHQAVAQRAWHKAQASLRSNSVLSLLELQYFSWGAC